jgi:hypothetical protein
MTNTTPARAGRRRHPDSALMRPVMIRATQRKRDLLPHLVRLHLNEAEDPHLYFHEGSSTANCSAANHVHRSASTAWDRDRVEGKHIGSQR